MEPLFPGARVTLTAPIHTYIRAARTAYSDDKQHITCLRRKKKVFFFSIKTNFSLKTHIMFLASCVASVCGLPCLR